MDGIVHISSVLSAPWVGWMMLGLVACAVLAEWAQPGVITQALSSFFARTDRTYRESPANFMGQLLITLFRLGTVSMTLFLCFCPAGQASLSAYGLIVAGVVAVVLVKMVLNTCIDYVFQLTRLFGDAYGPYGDLVTMISLVLYPAMLVLTRIWAPLTVRWIAGIAAVIFLALWIFRTWRTFVTSLIAPLYLVMYIATMEVLPMVGLAVLSEKIIAII